MFTFALITGVKNGWLDAATYGPAARKAWIAVIGYIDQNNDVTKSARAPTSSTAWTIISSARAEPATSTARNRCCGRRRSCCAKPQLLE